MISFANAKINLGLNITAKRQDGYHHIETIFYPVKLYDVVELIDNQTTCYEIKGIPILGDSNDNLCMRAFKLLQQDFKLPNQKIILLKNIPVGAGLGGGSADAAFLITLINKKFNLSLSDSRMQEYARKIGADCAFFIENKPVFAFNKGDEFKSVEVDLSAYYLVLIKPNIHISTAEAYSKVVPQANTNELTQLIQLPIHQWKEQIVNDFEKSIFPLYPQIKQIKDSLYRSGAIFAQMSGSGSTIYGIFEKKVHLGDLERENQVFYNV